MMNTIVDVGVGIKRKENLMNSKWHLYISLAKSIIRILSGIIAMGANQWLYIALGFTIAEILGVLEEVGDNR